MSCRPSAGVFLWLLVSALPSGNSLAQAIDAERPTTAVVQDSAGEVIEGAAVRAATDSPLPTEGGRVELTDASGRAVLPGSGLVQVEAPGFLSWVGEAASTITLYRPSRVTVRVFDSRSHEAVVGASVTLTGADPSATPAQTDGEGRLLLDNLEPGPIEVRVEAPGYLPRTVAAAPELEETEAMSVRLRRSASIRGTVLADAKPVPGALVRAVPAVSRGMSRQMRGPRGSRGDARGRGRRGGRPEGAGSRGPRPAGRDPLARLELTTDDKGLFVAQGIPASRRSAALVVAVAEDGRWGVAVVAGDKGLGDSAIPGGDADVSIDVSASQVVTGTVAWQDGAAAVGVPVVAEFSQEWVMPGGARRAKYGVSLETLFEESGGGPSTITDEEGVFSMLLPAGEWRLVSRPEGQADSEPVDVNVDGEAPLPVELILAQGRTLAGTVRDANGNAVPSAEVLATSGRRWGGQRVEGVVEPDGTFRVSGLQEGRVTLTARAPGFGETRVEVEEDSNRPVRLVLKATGTLVGRVISATTGEPLKHFTVSRVNLAEEEGRGRRWRGRNNSGEEILSDDGTFELREVPEGVWSTKVKAPGYIAAASASVELSSGQIADVGAVELYAGATIVGRVEDVDTQEPLLGATVTLEGLSGGSRWGRRGGGGDGPTATTDREGAFRLDSVPPGDFTVKARHADYPDSFEHTTRVAVSDDDAGKEIEAKIALELGGSVMGYVLDASGEPVEGASVMAMDPKARGFAGILREPVETGADGAFVLDDLPPGPVELRRSDRMGVETEVLVKKGEVVEATLQDAGLRVFGRVLVAGNAVRARVSLRARSFAAPRSDWGESYELVGVPPGEWEVEVEIRELGSTAKARVERASLVVPEDVPELEADFEFEEVDTSDDTIVLGRIVDSETEDGLSGVMVFATLPGEPTVTAQSKAGEFSLTLPEPGKWKLRVSTRGNPAKQYNSVDAISVVVENGELQSEPPVFTMERRTDLDIRVLDVAGAPVEGALCFTVTKEKNLSNALGLIPRQPATTDALGMTLVSASKPGLHDLLIVATPARAFVIIEDVEIGSGDELDFVLPPSGSLLISAEGVNELQLHGLPKGWWAQLAGPRGAGPLSYLGVIEQAGSTVKVNGLPAGEYEVMADGRRNVVEIVPPNQELLSVGEEGL